MGKKRIPELDLHPFPPEAARSALREFLVKAMEQKKSKVRIIHGIGDGFLERVAIDVLEEFGYRRGEYHYEGGNSGATIVHL
ncbi:MAG: Smr/MutS family protein [Firmicutes bacterium]|nr:Smr/MutS family protein [Bacillota bacterium]HOB21823.1 Smr/MutS family protein [Bacillota bacterium]HQD40540.1 Smr/MutS family protein [Bacillota bacterium]